MMFNEYGMFQMMKLRQQETERIARDAWKHYVNETEDNKLLETVSSKQVVNPCCQCTCA